MAYINCDVDTLCTDAVPLRFADEITCFTRENLLFIVSNYSPSVDPGWSASLGHMTYKPPSVCRSTAGTHEGMPKYLYK